MRPTLAQIGVKAGDARQPRDGGAAAQAADIPVNDHFVERHGLRYAGTHLILDLWEADRLDDPDYMRRILERAVEAARATLLHIHLHRFTDGGGVSGVAVLAESHISVHTWPERRFAAFDVFMCGTADPYAVIPILKEAFRPGRMVVSEHMRGCLG